VASTFSTAATSFVSVSGSQQYPCYVDPHMQTSTTLEPILLYQNTPFSNAPQPQPVVQPHPVRNYSENTSVHNKRKRRHDEDDDSSEESRKKVRTNDNWLLAIKHVLVAMNQDPASAVDDRDVLDALKAFMKGLVPKIRAIIQEVGTNVREDEPRAGIAETGTREEIEQGQSDLVSINLEAPEHSTSDDELISEYRKKSWEKPPKNDGRRNNNFGQYMCTARKCNFKTGHQHDWKRHEEKHQPQSFWICHIPSCPILRKGKSRFIHHRKDKVTGHASKYHPDIKSDQYLKENFVETRPIFGQNCGFCRETFESWEQRCDHILYHFQNDKKGVPEPMRDYNEQHDDDTDEEDNDQLRIKGVEEDHWNATQYSRRDDEDAPGGAAGGSQNFGTGSGSTSTGTGNYPPAERGSGDSTDTVPYSSQQYSERHHVSTSVLTDSCTLLAGFKCISLLGRGATSNVLKMQDKRTGILLALKIMRRRGMSQALAGAWEREVKTLRRFNHPNVAALITAHRCDRDLDILLMPVADKTLRDVLLKPGDSNIAPNTLSTWMNSMASALSHIHSRNVRHADIKPENILIQNMEPRICDFGISRCLSDTDSTSSSVSPMTPMYAAPEIAQQRRHGRKADVFSLGCVFLEMLTVLSGRSIGDLSNFRSSQRFTSRCNRQVPYWKALPGIYSWLFEPTCSSFPVSDKLRRICVSMLQYSDRTRPSSKVVEEFLFSSKDGFAPSICTIRLPPTQTFEKLQIVRIDSPAIFDVPPFNRCKSLPDTVAYHTYRFCEKQVACEDTSSTSVISTAPMLVHQHFRAYRNDGFNCKHEKHKGTDRFDNHNIFQSYDRISLSSGTKAILNVNYSIIPYPSVGIFEGSKLPTLCEKPGMCMTRRREDPIIQKGGNGNSPRNLVLIGLETSSNPHFCEDEYTTTLNHDSEVMLWFSSFLSVLLSAKAGIDGTLFDMVSSLPLFDGLN
jgi:serine/threonine protein kinase